MCIHMYIHIYIYVCVGVYIYTHMCLNVHLYTYIYTHIYIYIHSHTYIYIYTSCLSKSQTCEISAQFWDMIFQKNASWIPRRPGSPESMKFHTQKGQTKTSIGYKKMEYGLKKTSFLKILSLRRQKKNKIINFRARISIDKYRSKLPTSRSGIKKSFFLILSLDRDQKKTRGIKKTSNGY